MSKTSWRWLAAALTPVCCAAAVPPNDDIAAATVVDPAGASYLLDATLATASPGDPGCGTPAYQSLWYRYTSPVDQFVQTHVHSLDTPPGTRPRVSAWGGSPGALVPLDCHPDGHEIGVSLRAGQTMYLMLSSPVPQGMGNMYFSVLPVPGPTPPVPPKNNLFWYPQDVAKLPQDVSADVGAAQGDLAYDPPPCGKPGGALGDSLWFRYTAPADGSVDVLFSQPFDAPFIGVLTGTLDQPQFVACSSQGDSKPGATRFMARAGVTYLIEAGSGPENAYSKPATISFKPSPPPTGGSAAAHPRVQWRQQWHCIPEISCKKETHLLATVDLVCEQPLPAVQASITITQGANTISAGKTVDCSSGAATVQLDASDAVGFVPGPATLKAGGYDFDGRYDVGSTRSGQIVRY